MAFLYKKTTVVYRHLRSCVIILVAGWQCQSHASLPTILLSKVTVTSIDVIATLIGNAEIQKPRWNFADL